MEMNTVGWFEIYVADMERARNFYERVFDIKLSKLPNDRMEMWGFPMDKPNAYGATGALARMENVEPGGNSVLIYFTCEDCAKEESRVAEADGRVEAKKFSIGQHGFISIVTDSEGNTIGLHSMK